MLCQFVLENTLARTLFIETSVIMTGLVAINFFEGAIRLIAFSTLDDFKGARFKGEVGAPLCLCILSALVIRRDMISDPPYLLIGCDEGIWDFLLESASIRLIGL
jgi:hypothetical protein